MVYTLKLLFYTTLYAITTKYLTILILLTIFIYYKEISPNNSYNMVSFIFYIDPTPVPVCRLPAGDRYQLSKVKHLYNYILKTGHLLEIYITFI